MSAIVGVCFVCLGNICRSPTAEGIMRDLVTRAGLDARFRIDSAGTGAWHVGNSPDPRSIAAAAARGVRLVGQARRVAVEDFGGFDYLIAMDRENARDLAELAPDAVARRRIHLLRSFDPDSASEPDVPDPYYGGSDGFARVFEVCLAGCTGLLAHARTTHGLA